MELRTELERAQQNHDQRLLYTTLLAATLWVRESDRPLALCRPDSGERAIPVFFTKAEALQFWQQVAPGQEIKVRQQPFVEIAGWARPVAGVVVDPNGLDLVVGRTALAYISVGEVPGEFAAWLADLSRLGRNPKEVGHRLRQTYVYTITGPAPSGEQRMYLLEKSDDGTLAVACFSSPETLAQFAQIRRLFDAQESYQVAFIPGDSALRTASGLGAYVLVDPESPWETQLEPTLI